MKRQFCILASAILLPSFAIAAEPKYAAFEVTSHEDPRVSFQFSAADATSDSPVVISVAGRRLTNDDRKHRVSLQKHWLSLHVPEGAKFVHRELGECGLKQKNEFPFCDRYVFADGVLGRALEYFIYVGNWP